MNEGDILDENVDIAKYITRTIATIGSFRIKMYVPLFKSQENKSIITDWAKEVSPVITEHSYFIDDYAMVIIDNIGKGLDKSLEWRKQHLTMTQKNQYIFIKAFKDILKIMYQEKDIFYMKDGKLHLYNLSDEDIVKVFNAGSNNVFELRPAVIVDDDGEEYEGASLCINATSNIGPLVLDEIHAMVHILERIDIFLYSQSLINFYYSYVSKADANKVLVKRPEKKKLFVPKEEPPFEGEEKVESTIPIEEEDIFGGLGGDM